MIKLENVTKSFSENDLAVQNISLEIKQNETLILLGRSGCGKTTTLKMINRLIPFDSGDILINNKSILDLDPVILRRNIGYVIQETGLFPHQNIYENIATVPRLKKWPEDQIYEKILNILKIIKLPDSILTKHPHELSGGQKQRIGVARAIIADPDIILMDEPFGALDPITREELQEEFINLKNNISKTIVFVTHDIFEAFKIGDRIAIMENGSIIQAGTMKDITEKPQNDFIRRFIGRHINTLQFELNNQKITSNKAI